MAVAGHGDGEPSLIQVVTDNVRRDAIVLDQQNTFMANLHEFVHSK